MMNNIWIRTQDKNQLVELDGRLFITNDNKLCMNDRNIIIGEYKSRENAITALNEIENSIIGNGGTIIEIKEKF